jgi:hypothetical protein
MLKQFGTMPNHGTDLASRAERRMYAFGRDVVTYRNFGSALSARSDYQAFSVALGRSPERAVSQGPARPMAEVPPLMPTASPDIVWVQCPSPAKTPGAMCGKLPVPLDRRNPQGRSRSISSGTSTRIPARKKAPSFSIPQRRVGRFEAADAGLETLTY